MSVQSACPVYICEPCTGALARHLLHGAAEVQVDDVGPCLFDDAGRLDHLWNVATVDLDAYGAFIIADGQLADGGLHRANQRLGRHKLRVDHSGTKPFAQLTEAYVGDVLHRCEEERAFSKVNISYFHVAKVRISERKAKGIIEFLHLSSFILSSFIFFLYLCKRKPSKMKGLMRKGLATALLSTMCIVAIPSSAQVTPTSQMEKLSRGLVALPGKASGYFVSWRLLGDEDTDDVSFDLLRDGEVVVANLTTSTSYTDMRGTTSSQYTVVKKVGGEVVETSPAVTPWSQPYMQLHLQRPAAVGDCTYSPNDCSVGDVDADGEYELFVKWDPSNANVYLDCYKLDGTKLWRIDLGVNIRAGAHYTQYMVYDFDGDGRAEMMCKTAPGSKDGKGQYVNQAATEAAIKSASNTTDHRNSDGRIVGGQEYLTVFNGLTGAAIHTVYYRPNRDATYGGAATGTFNWDDRSGKTDKASYGNRGERYLAAVACLDGPEGPAYGIFSRGYYTYAYVWAVGFDGKELKQKWYHASSSKTNYNLTDNLGKTRTYTAPKSAAGLGRNTLYGNGNHNLSVADVDGDGCDEIIWGSAALDNDGKLFLAWNMRSNSGRLASTGVYIARLKFRIKVNTKVITDRTQDFLWGVRRGQVNAIDLGI